MEDMPATRAKTKRRRVVKLGPGALIELLKPARLEIYESLQIAGPASIAELGVRLGRPAEALYYHVRKLVAIGVIEERVPEAGRPGPGRRGAVFGPVGRLDAELKPRSRHSRHAWAEGGASVLRLALRDYVRVLESGDGLQAEGPRRNLVLRRIKARLDAVQLKQVNEHLNALHDLLVRHSENTTGELHALTYVMTPLQEQGQG
jgi:hypothetical protein